jgi:hypothetical protein
MTLLENKSMTVARSAGPDACVIEAGSDTPQMLALYLGMLEVDFRLDESETPELAEHLRALSARYARAVGPVSP